MKTKLSVGDTIKFYWHGELLQGTISKIDGSSITVRDAVK